MVERLLFERRKREGETVGQLTCKWTRAVDIRKSACRSQIWLNWEHRERERERETEKGNRESVSLSSYRMLVDVGRIGKEKEGGSRSLEVCKLSTARRRASVCSQLLK